MIGLSVPSRGGAPPRHGGMGHGFQNQFQDNEMSKKKEKRTVLSDEAEKGLLDSIKRWKRLAIGKRLEGESVGPEQCPLCCLYLEEECKGCPIARHMQRQFCAKTPCEKADAMYDEYGLDSMEFRAAARKELEFLKQVLKSYEIPGKGASVEQPKVPTVVRVKKDSLVEWEKDLRDGIDGLGAVLDVLTELLDKIYRRIESGDEEEESDE